MSTNPLQAEVIMTTDEVLAYLQVNLRTVYRLIKAGKIPAVRVGRQWRFRKGDIDAWLNAERRNRAPVGQKVPDTLAGRPQGVGRPRVLVVDDEESIRELLSKMLAMAEYDVETAPDGRMGIERLRQQQYDLLISDLKMPNVDGLSLIREARHLAASMPVLIITGYSSEQSAIEAVNLGVTGYLTKPFRAPQVLAATARAIGD